MRVSHNELERNVGERTEELRQSVATLAESAEHLRAMTDTAPDAIVAIDGENRITAWNRAAERLFGYPPGEALGQSITILMPQRFQPMHLAGVHRVVAGGERRVIGKTVELLGQTKSGREFPIELSLSEWQAAGKVCFTGIIRDITERKRIDTEIKHYVAQLETAFMSTVEVATTLGEMRDPYTAGHQRRVGEIAAAISAELGFDKRRQEGLRVAGYLHDIGKITIPAEILSKPGNLSPTEFQLVKGHSQGSYDALKNVEFPWPVAQVALQHHERMDGSGYPHGLKGESILLEARIMAVADVIEAMSSHRPYRPGLGIAKALAEIERGCGSEYDPDVADACLKLFREKSYVIPG